MWGVSRSYGDNLLEDRGLGVYKIGEGINFVYSLYVHMGIDWGV